MLLLLNVRDQDLEEELDISIPFVNFASPVNNLGGGILAAFSLNNVLWFAADN